jgi:hypothetical protein
MSLEEIKTIIGEFCDKTAPVDKEIKLLRLKKELDALSEREICNDSTLKDLYFESYLKQNVAAFRAFQNKETDPKDFNIARNIIDYKYHYFKVQFDKFGNPIRERLKPKLDLKIKLNPSKPKPNVQQPNLQKPNVQQPNLQKAKVQTVEPKKEVNRVQKIKRDVQHLDDDIFESFCQWCDEEKQSRKRRRPIEDSIKQLKENELSLINEWIKTNVGK